MIVGAIRDSVPEDPLVAFSASEDGELAVGVQASAGFREAVFGGVETSTDGGFSKFRAVSSLGTLNPPDLFSFDVSALVAALDSSMFLLYKDSGGNVVSNQVKVEALTGYLHVPA